MKMRINAVRWKGGLYLVKHSTLHPFLGAHHNGCNIRKGWVGCAANQFSLKNMCRGGKYLPLHTEIAKNLLTELKSLIYFKSKNLYSLKCRPLSNDKLCRRSQI